MLFFFGDLRLWYVPGGHYRQKRSDRQGDGRRTTIDCAGLTCVHGAFPFELYVPGAHWLSPRTGVVAKMTMKAKTATEEVRDAILGKAKRRVSTKWGRGRKDSIQVDLKRALRYL